MSLLGLLTMGRTFGTVRQRPPPYQLAEGWLPDFGRRQEHELGDLDGHETVLPGSGWPERNVGGSLTSSLFEAGSGPSHEPALTPALSRRTGEGARRAGEEDSPRFMAGEQVGKEQGSLQEPAGAGVGQPRLAERSAVHCGGARGSASPSGGGPMVQGELSLKSVRVVRNDLSADDLELIPRPARGTAANLVLRPGGDGSDRGGWRGWLAHWWCLFRRRAS